MVDGDSALARRGSARVVAEAVVCAAICLAALQPLTLFAQGSVLIAWTGDADRRHSDFLAVIQADRKAPDYGRVIATLPVGLRATHPHHTEHSHTSGKTLFAAGFAGNRLLRFDLSDPLAPRQLGSVDLAADLAYPHSFARLASGEVVVTMQGRNVIDDAPGGLAVYRDDGTLLRSASARDEGFDSTRIRPYGVAVVPGRDRLVVASGTMGLPGWHPQARRFSFADTVSHVQLWRASDLTLLDTLELGSAGGGDAHRLAYEPRVLEDGKTVYLATSRCGLFRLTGIEREELAADLVYRFEGSGCAVPLVVGRFWIQSVASHGRVVVLDVTDPRRPGAVSRLDLGDGQTTHWLAYDEQGERIVAVNEESGEARIWMLAFDPESGSLSVDRSFRDAGSERPGVSFDRQQWPHGATGPAFPHGTVFVRLG